MGFKIGAFARGFAQAAVDDANTKEEEMRELIKTSYANSLEQAQVLRKERREKREKMASIAKQLQGMGLDESQTAGILSMGVDGAETNLASLQAAQSEGIDVSSAVTAGNKENMTIEATLAKLYPTSATAADDQMKAILPAGATGSTFFGSLTGKAEDELEKMEGAFGESLADLQAETDVPELDLTAPGVTIDYKKLTSTTGEPLTAPQASAYADHVYDNFFENAFGVKKVLDKSGNYVLADGMMEKVAQARAASRKAVVEISDLIDSGMDPARALDQVLSGYGATEPLPPPPSDGEISDLTAEEYAESFAEDENVGGLGPDALVKKEEELREKLMNEFKLDFGPANDIAKKAMQQ